HPAQMPSPPHPAQMPSPPHPAQTPAPPNPAQLPSPPHPARTRNSCGTVHTKPTPTAPQPPAPAGRAPRPEPLAPRDGALRDADARDGVLTRAEGGGRALARLAPGPGLRVWDVGAGSGSVAVECARFGAAVIAVERDALRCERVRANAARHGVDVRIVPGEAP